MHRHSTTHTAISRTPLSIRMMIVAMVIAIAPFSSLFAHEAEENTSFSELLATAKASTHEPENCLSIRRFKNIKLLDAQHLLFQSTGRAWLNEMPIACKSLQRAQVLAFDRYARKLCKNDSIEGLNPKTGSQTGRCTIGHFIRIEKSLGRRLLKASNNQ